MPCRLVLLSSSPPLLGTHLGFPCPVNVLNFHLMNIGAKMVLSYSRKWAVNWERIGLVRLSPSMKPILSQVRMWFIRLTLSVAQPITRLPHPAFHSIRIPSFIFGYRRESVTGLKWYERKRKRGLPRKIELGSSWSGPRRLGLVKPQPSIIVSGPFTGHFCSACKQCNHSVGNVCDNMRLELKPATSSCFFVSDPKWLFSGPFNFLKPYFQGTVKCFFFWITDLTMVRMW